MNKSVFIVIAGCSISLYSKNDAPNLSSIEWTKQNYNNAQKIQLRFHLFELGIVCESRSHTENQDSTKNARRLSMDQRSLSASICVQFAFSHSHPFRTLVSVLQCFVVVVVVAGARLICLPTDSFFQNFPKFFAKYRNLNLAHNGLGADQCQWMATATTTVITTLNTTRVSGVKVNVGNF